MKVLRAIWDGVLSLVAYALIAALIAVTIIALPIMCILLALKNEIKLSEAFEDAFDILKKSICAEDED